LKKQDEKRESFLELFLEFVNFKFPEDFEGPGFITRQSEFLALLHTYMSFLCQFGPRYPFLNMSAKYDQYARDLLEKGSPEVYLDRMNFFRKLQEHLRSKTGIITDSLSGGDDTPVFSERPGKRKVHIDIEHDLFVETFWPKGVDSYTELDLAQEKALAEVVFADMVREEALMPSRFKRCEKCGNFFYQRTAQEKKFCSLTCSSYIQQQKYRSKGK
jgi:hypothetical protein